MRLLRVLGEQNRADQILCTEYPVCHRQTALLLLNTGVGSNGTLCRARHNVPTARLPVMPNSGSDRLCIAGFMQHYSALSEGGEGCHRSSHVHCAGRVAIRYPANPCRKRPLAAIAGGPLAHYRVAFLHWGERGHAHGSRHAIVVLYHRRRL